jgi:vacuolar-type H+-ATPase subunit H
MKLRILSIATVILVLSSCTSIPKETIVLSQTLGKDLKVLHNSHRNMVQLYYKKIKDNINVFIDEVYSPYIINTMLSSELQSYKSGEPSLYKAIEDGGKLATSEATEEALSYMQDFLEIAKSQITEKRESLLSPIEEQETELLNKINQSYEGAMLANISITNYLKSIQKLKETQQEVLSKVGLSGADTAVINTLMNVSEKVNDAVKVGKKIDIESDKALEEIEKVTKKIKQLTTKN